MQYNNIFGAIENHQAGSIYYRDENFYLEAVPHVLCNDLSQTACSFKTASTNYKDEVFIFEFYSDLIYYLINSFTLYMIEPSIFSIHKIRYLDLPIIFENFLRVFIILAATFNIAINKINNKHVFYYIIIYFIFIELFWSLGTNNWGTASRHHIPAFGLLVILSAIIFEKFPLIKNKANSSE